MIRIFAWIALLGVGIAVPLLFSEYTVYLINLIAVTGIVAVGLTLVTGIAGQVSLAQAAFSAIGGYGGVLLCLSVGLPLWLGILISSIMAAGFGYLLGLPALRLEGPYLALVTLGFTAIVQTVLIHWTGLTNGQLGIQVPPFTIAGKTLASSKELYWVIIPVTVLLFFAAGRITRSRIGRAFQAIRQSEVAAQVLGVNPVHYKTLAFSLSAFYGGIGGGFSAVLTTFLSPDAFGIIESIYFLVVIVVGGVASVGGALLGSALLVLLPETLSSFKQYQVLIYGVLLLTFIILAPGGLSKLGNSVLNQIRGHKILSRSE
jgi:branched-chain amino acid transport system permease protein